MSYHSIRNALYWNEPNNYIINYANSRGIFLLDSLKVACNSIADSLHAGSTLLKDYPDPAKNFEAAVQGNVAFYVLNERHLLNSVFQLPLTIS